MLFLYKICIYVIAIHSYKSISGPSGQPLAVFVGEDHKNEILLYARVMIAYFKSLNQISNHSLPLRPAYHLLSSFKNSLLFPGKLAILSSEHGTKLIISDSGNNRIVIATEHGEMEHFIGGCNQGFKDGNFKNARFNSPQGVCVLNNTIYVADNNNHAIRKVRRKIFPFFISYFKTLIHYFYCHFLIIF